MSMSEHLSLEIALARVRCHEPRNLPRVEILQEMVRGMDDDERWDFVGSLLTSSPLADGAPVPGCGCPACTGIPEDHPARGRRRAWAPTEAWDVQVSVARSRAILDVVQHLGMEPKKEGRKHWVCRCPFHEDNTPSFTISPDKGLWHCFGCGRGGDGIALTQTTLGLSFREAIQELT